MGSNVYDFRLAWRWMQPSHRVLPEGVMSRIVPVADEEATLVGSRRLDSGEFLDVRRTMAAGETAELAVWLRQLPVGPEESVVVRWDARTAVRTTWGIFVEYWDDFCYAGSDDVDVTPESKEWTLRYHHWEEFEWGTCRSESERAEATR